MSSPGHFQRRLKGLSLTITSFRQMSHAFILSCSNSLIHNPATKFILQKNNPAKNLAKKPTKNNPAQGIILEKNPVKKTSLY